MDILTAIAIERPCTACGMAYSLTLNQVLISQDTLLHEGCHSPYPETECPPATFAPLLKHALLETLLQTWALLEAEAELFGGTLSVRAVGKE